MSRPPETFEAPLVGAQPSITGVRGRRVVKARSD